MGKTMLAVLLAVWSIPLSAYNHGGTETLLVGFPFLSEANINSLGDGGGPYNFRSWINGAV
ncbi:hypothetical protein [Breznakiella homolactica]|uniref:Uncharacterized protein n=1 Tax=Breznakiella homolactica TaxID=2798577 RepID=A0A7T8B904_9SPIR|nr:hypothetical protein [Breznakiella homolactica]QQO07445.1 hypothetical protein JFL75_10780 [Breznakiella homolactica]